jgi:hypothetical protein
MRRELDRATALFSAESGGSTLASQDAKLLAPEVTWIEFEYFDGAQLWTEWDSTDRGGVPVAVIVRIWLRPPTDEDAVEAAVPTVVGSGPGTNDEMYRIVVHLPAAEPTSVDSTSTSTGTSSGSGSTSGGTTGGTSGSGTGGS